MNRPTIRRHLGIMFVVGLLGTVCLAASPSPRGPVAQKSHARVHDPHVVPAGGAACSCRGGTCVCGHPTASRGGHHPDCRDGRCGPYCPVRPQHYGFYGTQWRRWTGQGVMTVSDDRAATPALPPRMAVPGPDEESMRAPDDEEFVPESSSEPPADPSEFSFPEAAPPQGVPPQDVAPPAAEPDALVPLPAPLPAPEPAAAVPLPEDENLFNSSVREKARRKLAVGLDKAMRRAQGGGVVPTTHAVPVGGKSVPRVPFDSAFETRTIRERP